MSKARVYIVASLLLVVMFSLGLASVWNDSAVYDEVAHIPAGYSCLKTGDMRLFPEHPPLIRDLTALPLMFMDIDAPFDDVSWSERVSGQKNDWEFGRLLLYKYGNNANRIGLAARMPVLVLMVLLGIYIFKWARRLYGDMAALVALFFYAFSPTVLAHGRLATNDLGVSCFFFIAFYYYWLFIKKPGWKLLVVAGLAFGLAQLAKFSALLLVPLMIALTLVFGFVGKKRVKLNFPLSGKIKGERARNIYVLACSLLLIFVIGFSFVWIVYGIQTRNMPVEVQHEVIDVSLESGFSRDFLHRLADIPVVRSIAHYGLGLAMQSHHVAQGHPTYFMGENGSGWWYYYPFIFLIKVPLPTLLMLLLGVSLGGVTVYRWFRHRKRERKRTFLRTLGSFLNEYFDEVYIISPVLLFFAACLLGSINIGIRYLLPAFPFLFLLFARIFSVFDTRFGKRVSTGSTKIDKREGYYRYLFYFSVFGLLCWYLASATLIFPHFMAYFNPLAGGPENAYRFTVDSNLDWGQDLKRLKSYMDREGIEDINLCYFGNADPNYYGIDYRPFWPFEFPSEGELSGKTACSVSSMMMATPDSDWLQEKEPVDNIGYSIYIYDLE